MIQNCNFESTKIAAMNYITVDLFTDQNVQRFETEQNTKNKAKLRVIQRRNKAGCTATEVACGWARAIFGHEQ